MLTTLCRLRRKKNIGNQKIKRSIRKEGNARKGTREGRRMKTPHTETSWRNF